MEPVTGLESCCAELAPPAPLGWLSSEYREELHAFLPLILHFSNLGKYACSLWVARLQAEAGRVGSLPSLGIWPCGFSCQTATLIKLALL